VSFINRRVLLLFVMLIALVAVPVFAKDDRMPPKDFGVYMKTQGALKRILPNIVFDEKNVFFIESNNPQRFQLKDVEYLVIYGQQDMGVLTMNPLLFLGASPLGKTRYIFGKDIATDVNKKGKDLYSVKPKGLFGRGYFCLWINDSAWDFVIE
jgi:hypothetical protein